MSSSLTYPTPRQLTHTWWFQGLQVDDVALVEGQQCWVLRQEVPHSNHVVRVLGEPGVG